MRRTLTRTSAPILNSLRRIVPQVACANCVCRRAGTQRGRVTRLGDQRRIATRPANHQMLSLVVLGGARPGMVTVETIGRIRRAFWVDKKPIRQIVRELRISRQTVRKAIRGASTEFCYERQVQPRPRLGAYIARLDALLEANSKRSARERLTAQRLFELLRAEGYDGAYDSVQRHVREWRRQQSRQGPVFIPLWFGLPVRLVARSRGARWGDHHGQGRAYPAVPQPDVSGAGLPARDPGDGV